MARSKNLKGALLSHKSLIARKQGEERHRLHTQAKQASIRTTWAERQAAKRAALAKDLQSSSSSTSLPNTSNADAGSPASSRAKGKARETIHPNQKPIIPFQNDDTILLIGEANFSYALSLLLPPHNHPSHQIVATSYDTREVCIQKYPDALGILEKLEGKGVRTGFGVDATDLKANWRVVGRGKRWSRVIFNFPHVGAGITDQDRNILSNQTLLLRFLRSVNPLLTEGASQFPVTQMKKGKKVVQLRAKANNKRKKMGSDDEDDDVGIPNVEESEGDLDDLAEEGEDEDIDEEMAENDAGQTTKTSVEKDLDPPHKEGTILITLLHQPPYTLWDLPKLATRPPSQSSAFYKLLNSSLPSSSSQNKSRPKSRGGDEGPQPKYRLLRSFQFHPQLYSGYAHRRTIGYKEGVSRDGNEEILGRKGVARTWEFARAPEEEYQ